MLKVKEAAAGCEDELVKVPNECYSLFHEWSFKVADPVAFDTGTLADAILPFMNSFFNIFLVPGTGTYCLWKVASFLYSLGSL